MSTLRSTVISNAEHIPPNAVEHTAPYSWTKCTELELGIRRHFDVIPDDHSRVTYTIVVLLLDCTRLVGAFPRNSDHASFHASGHEKGQVGDKPFHFSMGFENENVLKWRLLHISFPS